MEKYEDIINLSRPVSNRPKMSLEQRSAQFAPFAALTGYEARRRPHIQGGAAHDQQIRLRDSVHRAVDDPVIQGLLIEHHVRLDDAAAIAPGNPCGVEDVIQIVEFSTFFAVIPVYAAVQLIDLFAASGLMKSVDVLGHHHRDRETAHSPV